MARETFIQHRFSSKSRAIIARASEIIGEYQKQGFTLTLRQLYYQFVARGVLPNQQSEYKRLGSIISDARLAGLIDWSAIEDRTRNLRAVSTWEEPADIIKSAAHSFRMDVWADQKIVPEVWIEKDALVGVVEGVCNEFRVPYFACRGYTSQSEQYAAGKRFAQRRAGGQRTVILHLGDHDPSGIDMTRDNEDRLAMFARHDVEVRRLALNMDQIVQYDPPPNPAKDTDARFGGYVEQFGEECWELDALDPTVIDKLIRDELDGIIDAGPWCLAMKREAQERRLLELCSRNWGKTVSSMRWRSHRYYKNANAK